MTLPRTACSSAITSARSAASPNACAAPAAEQPDREIELAERYAPEAEHRRLAREQRELQFGRPPPARCAAVALCPRERHPDADGQARRHARRQRRHNGAMRSLPAAPWWTVRRAANRKPATYRCPI